MSKLSWQPYQNEPRVKTEQNEVDEKREIRMLIPRLLYVRERAKR